MALKCEDREARIFKFLYNDVDGMLRQYEVPTHLSDVRVRDEINLMVGDVNREIPSSIGDASFDLLLIGNRATGAPPAWGPSLAVDQDPSHGDRRGAG